MPNFTVPSLRAYVRGILKGVSNIEQVMAGFWIVTVSAIVDDEAFAEYRKHWGVIAREI